MYFDDKDLVGSRVLFMCLRFRKKIQPVLCAVKMGEDQTALTGTVTGYLYQWKARCGGFLFVETWVFVHSGFCSLKPDFGNVLRIALVC